MTVAKEINIRWKLAEQGNHIIDIEKKYYVWEIDWDFQEIHMSIL